MINRAVQNAQLLKTMLLKVYPTLVLHRLYWFSLSEMNSSYKRSRTSDHSQSEVENILNTIKSVYKNCAQEFHEHYASIFNSALSHNAICDKRILKYDQSVFAKFVDDCMMFRLKVTIKEPLKSDIMYQLCPSVNPNLYTESLDSILEELIFSAIPTRLVDRLKQQLEIYQFDPLVLDLVLSKLEHSRL